MTPEEAEEIKARFLKAAQEGSSFMNVYYDPELLGNDWRRGSIQGWVRRSAPGSSHECAPPKREVVHTLPSGSLKPGVPDGKWTTTEVDGRFGDLWRCECGRLWRVGSSCDYGPHGGVCPRGGYHSAGLRWRPATWWQRLRYRGRP